MTPTMYAPTMRPTVTNAPFNSPLSNTISGYVVKNQYDSGSCSGNPATITGYQTNTCIDISTFSTIVKSVKYSCNTGKSLE